MRDLFRLATRYRTQKKKEAAYVIYNNMTDNARSAYNVITSELFNNYPNYNIDADFVSIMNNISYDEQTNRYILKLEIEYNPKTISIYIK